jgi:putative restriction endonuclease
MRRRIERYLPRARIDPRAEYSVGCLMIAEPVFFAREDWIRQPTDWGPQTVQGAGYDLGSGEGARVWRECLARAATKGTAAALVGAETQPRYGAPVAIKPRLGQGIFRIAVTDAYERACAITGEHSLPALEAAHIRPFSLNGSHDVTNGLLFRSDIHRLFDRGYVTVTPTLHFEVSRRLKEDFENGRSYYPLHGSTVRVPRASIERPSPELLQWHTEEVYRG